MVSPKVFTITPNRILNTPKVTKNTFGNKELRFYPPFLPSSLSNADVQGV